MNNEEISALSYNDWVKYKKENLPKLLNTYPNFDFKTRFEIMKNFKSITEKAGISLYLANGVLLGAVREKDFISWDDDVDMDVLIEELEPKYEMIKEQLISLGYIVRGIEKHPEMKINVYYGGEKVGILALYLKGDFRIRSSYKWPRSFYEEFEEIVFKGETFKTPKINDYLNHQYGTDWNTPKKKNYFNKDVFR